VNEDIISATIEIERNSNTSLILPKNLSPILFNSRLERNLSQNKNSISNHTINVSEFSCENIVPFANNTNLICNQNRNSQKASIIRKYPNLNSANQLKQQKNSKNNCIPKSSVKENNIHEKKQNMKSSNKKDANLESMITNIENAMKSFVGGFKYLKSELNNIEESNQSTIKDLKLK